MRRGPWGLAAAPRRLSSEVHHAAWPRAVDRRGGPSADVL